MLCKSGVLCAVGELIDVAVHFPLKEVVASLGEEISPVRRHPESAEVHSEERQESLL